MIQQPTNRAERRLYKRESARIHAFMGWIETAFLMMLFDESNGLSYQELYAHYLENFIAYAKEFNLNRAKGITVDEYYFSRQYHPVEKPIAA